MYLCNVGSNRAVQYKQVPVALKVVKEDVEEFNNEVKALQAVQDLKSPFLLQFIGVVRKPSYVIVVEGHKCSLAAYLVTI